MVRDGQSVRNLTFQPLPISLSSIHIRPSQYPIGSQNIFVCAGGVLALAVDSKYGKQKADAVNYYLCEKFGLLNNQLKGFKVKVRKGLLAVCQQLPGFVSMTLSKIRRHVTDVLKAWKALMKLEEHCVVRLQCSTLFQIQPQV